MRVYCTTSHRHLLLLTAQRQMGWSRAKRKILNALHPVVNSLSENWEHWISQISACLNNSISQSTGKTPHYISYRVDKILPYNLFSRPQNPVYDIDNYAEQQLHIFANIHNKVHKKLQGSRVEMMAKQHKKATPVNIKEGDNIMVHLPDRKSKLSPRFTGPRCVKTQAWK